MSKFIRYKDDLHNKVIGYIIGLQIQSQWLTTPTYYLIIKNAPDSLCAERGGAITPYMEDSHYRFLKHYDMKVYPGYEYFVTSNTFLNNGSLQFDNYELFGNLGESLQILKELKQVPDFHKARGETYTLSPIIDFCIIGIDNEYRPCIIYDRNDFTWFFE